MIFKKFKFTNKIINTISATTFGIYLIHEHKIVREILWGDFLDNLVYKLGLFEALAIITVSVFVVCSIIEFIRMKTIGKLSRKLSDNIETKLVKILNNEKEQK